MVAACRILCLLGLSVAAQAQWDEGMDPREEEYFAARMRQPHHGHNGDMWQQPQQARGGGLAPVLGGLLAGFFVDRQWGLKEDGKALKEFTKQQAAMELQARKLMEQQAMQYQMKLDQLDLLIDDAELKISELQEAAKDAGLNMAETQAKVDMEEFKQPDKNGDGNISRKEFNAYIADYVKQYPHLNKKDMPKFEDFDKDSSGKVTFAEWQNYLERQRREEERQALIEEQHRAAAGGRR